ncbi:MAG: hypothetical protein QG581_381 [Patescibacteria group bacterium]|jgi:hypothetical protein|nr:hypothetical protein [Patescibacteria group bacterium]
MCGANIFPQILRIAGIPETLHARTIGNDSVTLGQAFVDRPESEFLHAVRIFEQFKAGKRGSITRETTIGELRTATRENIIDENIQYLSLTGSAAETMRTRLAEKSAKA